MNNTRFVERCVVSDDKLYRYVLEVRIAPLEKPTKKLVVIQKNPSTADQFTTDQTVRRVENWARGKGFTTVKYLNLFAFRSKEPKALNNQQYDVIVGDENDKVLADEINTTDTVIIGWGNPNNIRRAYYNKRSREVHQLIVKVIGQINVVGVITNDGYPRHGLMWQDKWTVSTIENSSVFAYMKNIY